MQQNDGFSVQGKWNCLKYSVFIAGVVTFVVTYKAIINIAKRMCAVAEKSFIWTLTRKIIEL
jgi:hypothetical protein